MNSVFDEPIFQQYLRKLAQQVSVSPEDVAAVKQLVSKLQSEIENPTNPNDISVQSAQPADLTSPNLENLGTLVEFLARNQITVNNQRVAFPINENPNNPAYQLFKLEAAAGLLELANRNEAVNYGYYIDPKLLHQYILSLQQKLSDNPNPIFKTQLQSLIQEANDQLSTKISQEYQPPSPTLAPDQLVDQFPSQITSQNPTQKGNVILNFGDIAANTTFNSWLARNQITFDNKKLEDPQFNFCGLLKILKDRAEQYKKIAQSDKDINTYTISDQQISNLAGSYKCDLGGSQSNQGQTNKQPENDKATILQQIVSSLPLSVDDIDFNHIRNFISQYQSWMRSNNNIRQEQATQAITQAEQYMQAATQNTVRHMTIFPINGITAQDLVDMAVPPQPGQPTRSKGSAVALADYLIYTVQAVYTIIADLASAYHDQLVGAPDMRQAVEQQIGGSSIPRGSSIAYNNIDMLRAAKSRLSEVGS